MWPLTPVTSSSCCERCERLVAGRPELELLSARHRLLGPEDDG